MKVHSKKLLSVLLAMMMALGLMAPALASEGSGTTNSNAKVQITKTLRIGRGITVPTETFKYTVKPSTTAELNDLEDKFKDGYLNQNLSQQGVSYPDLTASGEEANSGIAAKVEFSSAMRGDGATDTELTFLTNVIDLSTKTWPSAGVYIYTVREVSGSTTGMTYDSAHYFLKVYVGNDNSTTPSTTKVTDVRVLGFDQTKNEWDKVEGSPIDIKETVNETVTDGCDDYKGNDFVFVNTYEKLVEQHPNTDATQQTPIEHAFYLDKAVSGEYANKTDAFDFLVTVTLPDSFSGSSDTDVLRALVNGYSAHNINPTIPAEDAIKEVVLQNDTQYSISLRHGDTFQIKKLPAGTVITVEEQAFTDRKYTPSFVGRWGLDVSKEKTGSSMKNHKLESGNIVVGEKGAFIQYTNTLESDDVTHTGIVISNLPYILMVGISLAGIGFFTLSKKRRNG